MRRFRDYSPLPNLAMATAISNSGGDGLQFVQVIANHPAIGDQTPSWRTITSAVIMSIRLFLSSCISHNDYPFLFRLFEGQKWFRKFEQADPWRIWHRRWPSWAMKEQRRWQNDRDGHTQRCSTPKWRWPRCAARKRWPNWPRGLTCVPTRLRSGSGRSASERPTSWRWNRFGGAAD